MGQAMLAATYFCGTISGVLWMSLLEKEERERARPYGYFMILAYSLSLLTIIIS